MKRLVLTVLASLVAVLAAACGADATATPTEPPPATATGVPEPPPEPTPTPTIPPPAIAAWQVPGEPERTEAVKQALRTRDAINPIHEIEQIDVPYQCDANAYDDNEGIGKFQLPEDQNHGKDLTGKTKY